MKFQIEMEAKEAELLERYDGDVGSSDGLEDKSGIPPWSQMTLKETGFLYREIKSLARVDCLHVKTKTSKVLRNTLSDLRCWT